MYLIINKTNNTTTKVVGNFPTIMLNELLEQGDDLIVVSTYSNTVKVPFIDRNYQSYETKSGYEWGFKDHPFIRESKS